MSKARKICVLSAVMMSLTMTAAERYYDRPMPLDAGAALTDTVGPGMLSWIYHCRVEPPKRSVNPCWSFTINGDKDHRYNLMIARKGQVSADADYALPIEVRLTDDQGRVVKEYELNRDIDPAMDALSVVLEKRAGCDSVDCRIGQRLPLLEFTALAAGDIATITLNAQSKLGLLRLSLTGEVVERGGMSVFESVEALHSYLSASADQSEKLWRYLDRDADGRILNLGGDYRIATVANADGGYDIIYLGGARVNSGYWKPLKIKGRLKPTPFINHYDLIWYDVFGRPLDRETSADIENNSILRLNLPLNGGTIRFAPQ